MADEKYDRILVECCACCLCLENPQQIELDGKTMNICPYCGSSETEHLTIANWDLKFQRKYGLGKYINLPKGMKWREIMTHVNDETREEENIRRYIRNKESEKLTLKQQLK